MRIPGSIPRGEHDLIALIARGNPGEGVIGADRALRTLEARTEGPLERLLVEGIRYQQEAGAPHAEPSFIGREREEGLAAEDRSASSQAPDFTSVLVGVP